MMKTSDQLRQSFLDFFVKKGHVIMPSSTLVPADDQSLLFTNSGMVQFKDIFTGQSKMTHQRVVTAQRCMRAGGKHNDLENVGYTARHHTFFEMLGNFSFGDYFKHETITYAWEYLTEVLGLPAERLWVTVFEDDQETADIWLKNVGISRKRMSYCGEKDNFWAMGNTGPCGPCSEIFYDHGSDFAGSPPGSGDEESERYIEIWNLVFTQFDRAPSGKLNPIPHPSVDTGMGLERISAVLQGVHNNYDTELFSGIIDAIKHLLGDKPLEPVPSRVIADHIRASTFLIADGIVPSNDGRGYVLRRIIRRAIRYGHKLGFKGLFFYKLLDSVIQAMATAYPSLSDSAHQIKQTLKHEEQRFEETLEQGLKLLNDIIATLPNKVISGKDAFRLYDTYGFPLDLTLDIAREQLLSVDVNEFHQEMEKQRQRARSNNQFAHITSGQMQKADELISVFNGYESSAQKAEIVGLYHNNDFIEQLDATTGQAAVVLSETPFYAESGGQVGDTGKLKMADSCFEVEDTHKYKDCYLHIGKLRTGNLKIGDIVYAEIDQQRRLDIVRHHSATHLLHAALRIELGNEVTQKGSLVAPQKLRFDFSYHTAPTQEQLSRIEHHVNQQILSNIQTQIRMMPLDKAKKLGAISLFGEKYGEQVRVLDIAGTFSRELCGGTHVERSADIGLFKIISETGIAANIRRIEAVAGDHALKWVVQQQEQLKNIAVALKTNTADSLTKLHAQLEKTKTLEKQLTDIKRQLAKYTKAELLNEVRQVEDIHLIAKILKDHDKTELRRLIDDLKTSLDKAVLLLASHSASQKADLVIGITPDLTDQIQADKLMIYITDLSGGNGGGRADLAQAGGIDPQKLPIAFNKLTEWLSEIKLSCH